MANIGGNIEGNILTKEKVAVNAIGEPTMAWETAFTIKGWLGLQNGDSKRTHLAKIEESTHVFLCDFHSGIYGLANQDTRMVLKGIVYDVLLIDNPDEMDEQLEIYLKRIGALDGSTI